MKGSVEELMYNVDIDGSSLLHLAVNSGVLGVRIRLRRITNNELEKFRLNLSDAQTIKWRYYCPNSSTSQLGVYIRKT